MKKFTIITFLIASLFLLSCKAGVHYIKYNTDVVTTIACAEWSIPIIEGKPDIAYTELGAIGVSKESDAPLTFISYNELIDYFEAMAAELGGDAVIDVKIRETVEDNAFGRKYVIHATGVVVSLDEIKEGEPYEVRAEHPKRTIEGYYKNSRKIIKRNLHSREATEY